MRLSHPAASWHAHCAFEGEDVEKRVRVLINDPVRAASFTAWVPLLAGRPALAHEVYYWEEGG
jgi:hypothetical protein